MLNVSDRQTDRQTQCKDEDNDVSAAATGSDDDSPCDVTTQLSYSDVIHKGEEGAGR